MNRYFGTIKNGSRQRYAKNQTLAGVRAAILQNKALMLGTDDPEKWHSILREAFPDVKLRIIEGGVMINEKS